MFKRLLVIVIPVGIGAALILQRQPPASAVLPVPEVGKAVQAQVTSVEKTPPVRAPEEDTPARRILELAKMKTRPAEMAALLRELYSQNPNGLFDTLIGFGTASLETRKIVLPLLADALVLWPEAEGRYVFPIADAYAAVDLPAAAEWGAIFLIKTNRSDLAASSLLGLLSEKAEGRALYLITSLPDDARRDAMNSVAYHIQIGDLNHLMDVCTQLDAQGTSKFSQQLFERLAMERLDETAAWLQSTPEAARMPGAISAIGQAIVSHHGPQQAMAWADSLPDVNAEAQAITSIYREWAKESPASAITDILANYDGAPQLIADVFKGAAEHHGSGAATQWDAARSLVNPSARAYAISSLIEPMLTTIGPAETQARIAVLPTASLEREVAESMIHAVYMNPATVRQIETRFGESP